MNIVLDTNIILVSSSSRSQFHWVIQSLKERKYNLLVTTDILLEYEEIIERFMGKEATQEFIKTVMELSNIKLITNYFKWEFLNDPDDNKFVDCAISGIADYIVTEDGDFSILKNIAFPKVQTINLNQFKDLLL